MLRVSERVANVVFGVNIIAWGVLGITLAEPQIRWTVVRLSTSALHCVVGFLFLFRGEVVRHGSTFDMLQAVPSFAVCGLAFFAASPINQWSLHSEVLFAVATFFAIVSLLCLGKNFAIFPALRHITRIGPYRLIRHPAYASELLLVVACWLGKMNVLTTASIILIVPLIVVRIRAEERVLSRDSDYEQYQATVPWRLIPGIW